MNVSLPKSKPQRWGPWWFDTTTGYLIVTIPSTHVTYDIPMCEVTDSATALDWLFQVTEKTWSTDAIVANLVSAFYSLVGRGVCGSGIDSPVDMAAQLKSVYGTICPPPAGASSDDDK